MTTPARLADDVVFEVVDGEAVLLHLERGRYHGLNRSGTRFLELIVAHQDLDQVRASMLEEFDVADGRLDTDLDSLVRDLVAAGLLIVEPTT